MNRRRLFKLGLTATGGALGYTIVGGMTGFIGRSLEAAVNTFYNVSHAVATELSGAAEKQLQRSADEVRTYLGGKRTEYQNLSTFWNDPTYQKLATFWKEIELLNPKDHQELTHILDNVDRYTKESHLGERLTRLVDRVHKPLMDGGLSLHDNLPGPLRRFNEWVAGKIEKNPRAVVEEYRQRLAMLIKVYDLNKDNKLAQSHLLSNTANIFAAAQQGVVNHLVAFLDEGFIRNPEERAFLEKTLTQLRSLGKEDQAGKKAEYLLQVMDYVTTLRAFGDFGHLHNQLTGTLGDSTRLQQTLDQGIQMKDDFRRLNEEPYERRIALLHQLQPRFDAYGQTMEAVKGELERKGQQINYELFPRYREAKDAVVRKLHQVGSPLMTAASYAGALLGAVVTGYIAHKAIKSDDMTSRRKFLGIREENKKLREELKRQRKLNKPQGE